ncbi:high mobility group box domain-containing protein [Blakeslea trispora]|nr:high mobility group box domain-containing protein [Blakeslea trispora]
MTDNRSNDKARAAAIIKEITKNLHDFSEVLLKLATEGQVVAPAKVEEQVDHKKKKEKDPNAPKRNLSSYMLYSQEVRPKIVAKNPELKAIEVAKLIGEMWNGLSDKEKQPYIKKAEVAKAAFDKENEKYKASLGETVSTPAKRKAESSNQPKKAKKSTKPEKPVKTEKTEKSVESEKPAKSEKKKTKKTESKTESTDGKKKAKKNK